MSNTNMNDRTRQIVIVIFSAVAGLIVLLASWYYFRALTAGTATVPEYVKGQFWLFILAVLTAATPWIREYLARKPRQLTQDKIDATHSEVVALREEVHNGVQDAIAQKVAAATVEQIKHDPEVLNGIQPVRVAERNPGRRSTDRTSEGGN